MVHRLKKTKPVQGDLSTWTEDQLASLVQVMARQVDPSIDRDAFSKTAKSYAAIFHKAIQRAETISHMCRGPDVNLAAIQTHLEAHPIDVLTLIALLGRDSKRKIKARDQQKAKDAAEKHWSDEVNNEKVKAKKEIHDHWKSWQDNPTRYRNLATFARAMLEKYPALDSNQTIERWCREWRRGDVHECWTAWQHDPDMYDDVDAFVLAMTAKHKASKKKHDELQQWCQEWAAAEVGYGLLPITTR